ncbi:MAG: protease modulator HflK, partial [Glaciecola sp.]|nr:protease modulator HflK [Glaciecola sp.]
RQRIYLETMEELFSNTSKIMVDNQNGGGSMMYLPLDKIMERQNTNSNMSLPTNATQNALDGLRNAATPDANGNSRPTSNIRSTNSRTGR